MSKFYDSNYFVHVVKQEINHVAADLLKEEVCKDKLKGVTDVEFVFYATWVNKGSEKENCVANAKMVRTELRCIFL